MPTIEENQLVWDNAYDWSAAGDEWSGAWGTPEMQWYSTLLPRIHAFLPAPTILEIAPGFGRWTHFLKDRCDRLVVVDLSERCIEACKERFRTDTHITYHVNDGRSLAMVEDHSIDFAFSFDSLVHADASVLQAYLEQLATKLTPDGVAVLHHSNSGEYARSAPLLRKLPGSGKAGSLGLLGAYVRYAPRLRKVPVGRQLLAGLHRLGLVDLYWRDRTVSAATFRAQAEAAGLRCASQELIGWLRTRRLIDCISVVTPAGSRWARPTVVVRNPRFMREAEQAHAIAPAYSVTRAPGADDGRVAASHAQTATEARR